MRSGNMKLMAIGLRAPSLSRRSMPCQKEYALLCRSIDRDDLLEEYIWNTYRFGATCSAIERFIQMVNETLNGDVICTSLSRSS
jgi:hypothetical protein